MKVSELLEHRTPHKLSSAEIESLPEPSARNMNDRYRVGSVPFDNVKGMGAVPNNQEVDYLGFAVEMSPTDFLKLAARADRGDTAEEINRLLKDGAALGAPYLSITYNAKEFGQGDQLRVEVVGHEGRARALAFHNREGSAKLPVHIFLKGGMRAHDLSERFFEELRKIGMVPERLDVHPLKVPMGRIFWMGKTL